MDALTRAAAAEGRELNRRLADDVARGSAQNLVKAQATLGEVQRLLQPVGNPQVTVFWELPQRFPTGDAFLARLDTIGKRLRNDPAAVPSGVNVSSCTGAGRMVSITIRNDSPLSPDHLKEPEL